MKPVAVNGPILTIRTFPEEPLTMKKLIDCGSMTEEAAQFIRKLVIAKYNIFALTSRRPYKEPYAPYEATEYLMGGCGIMFDREVVDP